MKLRGTGDKPRCEECQKLDSSLNPGTEHLAAPNVEMRDIDLGDYGCSNARLERLCGSLALPLWKPCLPPQITGGTNSQREGVTSS